MNSYIFSKKIINNLIEHACHMLVPLSVFLRQHSCKGREVLVHGRMRHWCEVSPQVTRQGHEDTVRKKL